MATAPLTYGSYLRVPELLSLQRPLSDPPHHDELLFILIHQVYELWFKQTLHELDAAVRFLERDDLLKAGKAFRRIHAIQHILAAQVDVLETMTPQDFNEFRTGLNPASGFQSAQFREIEFRCGLRMPEEALRRLDVTPQENDEAHYALYLLLEDLIEFDERVRLWRGRHVLMVERMIGMKPGTGGSLGVSYLQKTLQRQFFPELWEVRTVLGESTTP